MNVKPTGLITGVTLSKAVSPDTFAPLDSVATFGSDAIIHAVVAFQDAAQNTTIKAVWYATDVAGVAPCNTLIAQALLTELDGSHAIDFQLGPGNPAGSYRVEISVNGQLDRVVTFTVLAGRAVSSLEPRVGLALPELARSFKFYALVQALPDTGAYVGDLKVGGLIVHVATSTQIVVTSGAPAVGSDVEARGTLRVDGTVDAVRIETRGRPRTGTTAFGNVSAFLK